MIPPRYQTPRLMIDPQASPTEKCLDELVQVMRKWGMVLGADAVRPGVILLGKISDGVIQAKVIAEIQQINVNYSVWRTVEGGPKLVKIQ